MKRSGRRGILIAALALALALTAVLTPLLLFWPSNERISVGEGDYPMPGGGPGHLFYLPYAPRGNLSQAWSTRLEDDLAGPAAVAGERVYVACGNGFLYCLDRGTGRPLWRFDAGGGVASMPSVSEEGIFLGTLDGRMLSVDARGRLKWELEVGGAVASSPVPHGGRLYFGSADNHLYCVRADDGSKVWDFDALSPLEASPCLYAGQVFCVSFEGDLCALAAEDGRLLWTYRTRGIPVGLPAADDGRVFLATETEVHCADVQSGRVMWKVTVGPVVISNLAVRGSQLIVVYGGRGEESHTISVDTRTGDKLWETPSGQTAEWTWLFATNQDAYLCGPDNLRALSVDSGIPSLAGELEGALPQTLAVTEQAIFVGSENRKVYCLVE